MLELPGLCHVTSCDHWSDTWSPRSSHSHRGVIEYCLQHLVFNTKTVGKEWQCWLLRLKNSLILCVMSLITCAELRCLKVTLTNCVIITIITRVKCSGLLTSLTLMMGRRSMQERRRVNIVLSSHWQSGVMCEVWRQRTRVIRLHTLHYTLTHSRHQQPRLDWQEDTGKIWSVLCRQQRRVFSEKLCEEFLLSGNIEMLHHQSCKSSWTVLILCMRDPCSDNCHLNNILLTLSWTTFHHLMKIRKSWDSSDINAS